MAVFQLRTLLASAAFGLFVVCLTTALALGGVVDMAAVKIVLVLAWVAGVFAIFETMPRTTKQPRRLVASIA